MTSSPLTKLVIDLMSKIWEKSSHARFTQEKYFDIERVNEPTFIV